MDTGISAFSVHRIAFGIQISGEPVFAVFVVCSIYAILSGLKRRRLPFRIEIELPCHPSLFVKSSANHGISVFDRGNPSFRIQILNHGVLLLLVILSLDPVLSSACCSRRSVFVSVSLSLHQTFFIISADDDCISRGNPDRMSLFIQIPDDCILPAFVVLPCHGSVSCRLDRRVPFRIQIAFQYVPSLFIQRSKKRRVMLIAGKRDISRFIQIVESDCVSIFLFLLRKLR